MKGLVRQKDSGNKQRWHVEKQNKKLTGKKNLELSSRVVNIGLESRSSRHCDVKGGWVGRGGEKKARWLCVSLWVVVMREGEKGEGVRADCEWRHLHQTLFRYKS